MNEGEFAWIKKSFPEHHVGVVSVNLGYRIIFSHQDRMWWSLQQVWAAAANVLTQRVVAGVW